MIQPDELKYNQPLLWSTGAGLDVWELFCACAAGDLETVKCFGSAVTVQSFVVEQS